MSARRNEWNGRRLWPRRDKINKRLWFWTRFRMFSFYSQVSKYLILDANFLNISFSSILQQIFVYKKFTYLHYISGDSLFGRFITVNNPNIFWNWNENIFSIYLKKKIVLKCRYGLWNSTLFRLFNYCG